MNVLSFPPNEIKNGRVFESAVELCWDKHETPTFIVFRIW